MFGGSLRLPFRLLGIPVRLDTSFLLVLPLFAWLIGSQIPAYAALLRRAGFAVDPGPLLEGPTPWLLGLAAALGLFASVVIHELGHSVVARLYGVEVKEITLWFLGGMAQFEEMPRQRGAEAVVSLAGPVTSVLIALTGLLLLRVGEYPPGVLFVLSYLTVTNFALAVFNLLPALPLDGGRVLRSVLALAMPHLTATNVAALISRVIAILIGVYGFMGGNLLLLAVAFFIYNAVRAETQYAVVADVFSGLTVRDLMTSDVVTVEPDQPVEQLVKLFAFRKHLGFPVTQDGRLLGFARIHDAREARPDAPISSIMVPAETIGPDEDALEAVKRINASGLGRLMVEDPQGRLIGLLSKTDLVRRLELAAAAGAGRP